MGGMYDPAHPGEIIREAIVAEGWTVGDAAARLGVTRKHAVAGAERQGRRVASARDCSGAPRLERRRPLGAYAGSLRVGASPESRIRGLRQEAGNG